MLDSTFPADARVIAMASAPDIYPNLIFDGPLSQFAADNEMDPAALYEELEASRDLKTIGPKAITIGGGAAPEFTIILVMPS